MAQPFCANFAECRSALAARFAMGHFKISDLRLIFENDERFLTQF